MLKYNILEYEPKDLYNLIKYCIFYQHLTIAETIKVASVLSEIYMFYHLDSKKIKYCPFCGNRPTMITFVTNLPDKDYEHGIEIRCAECDIKFMKFTKLSPQKLKASEIEEIKDELIKKWNTRYKKNDCFMED